MTRILFGLLLFVTVFAQPTIVPRINPLLVSPDFVLVLLFMWSAARGTREAVIWVFVTGLVLDILSLDPLGTNGLALLIVAVLAGLARRRVFHSNIVVPILLVIVATLVHGVVLYALRGTLPGLFIVLQALLHALLVPPIYLLVRWLDR